MAELKPGWQRVKFAELAECVNDRVDDPANAGVDRYVGLEHLDPDSLTIRRWGSPADVESTKLRFQPGDIIFGKRRAYQRKLVVADFEGICSAHAMVLRTKSKVVLPEFLPFFMQSDLFMRRAVEISVGSLSPTINWKTLSKEEFVLPPLNEQCRAVRLLKTIEKARAATREALQSASTLVDSTSQEILLHDHLQRLKDSENFAPPNGWRQVTIADMCERITYGFTNPMPTEESGPWMITAKDVVDGQINYGTARRTSTEAYDGSLTAKSKPLPGDILLTKDGTLGRVAIVDRHNICVNQSVAVLRPKSSIPSEFLARTLRSPGMQHRLFQDIGGTAVKHLYISKIGLVKLIIPDSTEKMQRIASFLSELEAAKCALEARLASFGCYSRYYFLSQDA